MRVFLGYSIGVVAVVMFVLQVFLVPLARAERTERGRKRNVLGIPLMFRLGSREDFTEDGWQLRNKLKWVFVIGFSIALVLMVLMLQTIDEVP